MVIFQNNSFSFHFFLTFIKYSIRNECCVMFEAIKSIFSLSIFLFSFVNMYVCVFNKALVIKPSNIRIWIHDKDIDKLMKVVLEGHGQKLRQEVSSNQKVKRFLEYVPHFLGLIKSIHTAVIENNIELLRAKTAPPVPPQFLSCKDSSGLTPLHKAAGLGHTKILEYLLDVWPNAVQEIDNHGRTPLHYAASVKNNERAFNLLVQGGADELAIDGVNRKLSIIYAPNCCYSYYYLQFHRKTELQPIIKSLKIAMKLIKLHCT